MRPELSRRELSDFCDEISRHRFYETFSLARKDDAFRITEAALAKRQNLEKQRAERFRFVVRTRVPARGFGLAGDEVHSWLRERVGLECLSGPVVVVPISYLALRSPPLC